MWCHHTEYFLTDRRCAKKNNCSREGEGLLKYDYPPPQVRITKGDNDKVFKP